jgi:hypothetical protein
MNSPWPSADTWTLPLFFIAFGVLLLIMGFTLLTEYRRLFFSDPRAAMTIDVLGHLLELGAPGYLGLFGLGFGAFFLAIGAFMAVALVVLPILEILRQVLYALTFNFQ